MKKEIEAKDLRIGNWVQHEPCVDEKWEVDITLLEHINNKLVYVVGIPLTPEILEKAGFEYDDVMYYKVRIMLSQRNDGQWAVWYGTLTHGRIDECDISYVHQLQNVVFSLTQKELIINL